MKVLNNCSAAFFTVLRGKYSEGYNLKNEFSRAIYLIGVPFINIRT